MKKVTAILIVLVMGLFMVTAALAASSKVTITGSDVVAKGKTVTLKASQVVTWKSGNTKIATISSSGKVKGIRAGNVTITATTRDGKKKTWKMTVKKNAVKSVSITGITDEMMVGDTLQLQAAASPADAAQSFTWKSNNKKVATVDENGKVTALKAGKVKITATARDGSGKKATCALTVKKKSADVPAALDVTLESHEGNTYTFAMTVPGLKEKYPVNEPETPKDAGDFALGFSVACGNLIYEISTTHWKSTDVPMELSLEQMQTNIWEVNPEDGSARSIGDVQLEVRGTKVYLTVDFPETFKLAEAMIESAEYRYSDHNDFVVIKKKLQ